MRRILAVLLMLLVPLQLSWSAALGAVGHAGEGVPALGFHVHHDHAAHEPSGLGDHDEMAHGGAAGLHQGGGGSHGELGTDPGHYHPALSFVGAGPAFDIVAVAPRAAPAYAAARLNSHIPPPLDWPPAARSYFAAQNALDELS